MSARNGQAAKMQRRVERSVRKSAFHTAYQDERTAIKRMVNQWRKNKLAESVGVEISNQESSDSSPSSSGLSE